VGPTLLSDGDQIGFVRAIRRGLAGPGKKRLILGRIFRSAHKTIADAERNQVDPTTRFRLIFECVTSSIDNSTENSQGPHNHTMGLDPCDLRLRGGPLGGDPHAGANLGRLFRHGGHDHDADGLTYHWSKEDRIVSATFDRTNLACYHAAYH
jgi:hypothetical protein